MNWGCTGCPQMFKIAHLRLAFSLNLKKKNSKICIETIKKSFVAEFLRVLKSDLECPLSDFINIFSNNYLNFSNKFIILMSKSYDCLN